jgi:hypothetical protein|tara:strand:+ start:807 stop:1616 length:810 start_codon:yes stop_codon:yes gene_type:complete
MVLRYPKRTLLLSVVLATTLHAALLLVPLMPSIPVSQPVRQSITVTLVPRIVQPPVDVAVTAVADVPDSVDVEATVDQEIRHDTGLSPAPPKAEANKPDVASETPVKGAEPEDGTETIRPPSMSVQAMVRTYVAREKTESQLAPTRTCDLAQRASKIRHCDEDNKDFWREVSKRGYEETLDVAFAPQTYGDHLRHKRVLVARLVERQKLLNEIVESQGFEADDIAAMRREISRDIDHIERQYPSGNLFQMIGVAAEVATELWKAARAKE